MDCQFYCSLYCYTFNQLPANIRKRTADGAQVAAKTAAAPQAAPVLHAISLPSQTHQVGNVTYAMTGAKSVQPPVILNNATPQQPSNIPQAIASGVSQASPSGGAILPIEVQHKVVTVPPRPKEMKNKAVWCRPVSQSRKSVSTQSSKTDEQEASSDNESKYFIQFNSVCLDNQKSVSSFRKPIYVPIPIPVPIFIPVPMAMYSVPAPFPVGFPVAYPTPIMIPVDANDAAMIIKALEESKADETAKTYQTEPTVEVVPLSDENTETPSETPEQKDEESKPEDVDRSESQSELGEMNLILSGEDLEKTIPSCPLRRLFITSRKRSSSTSTPVPIKRFKGEVVRSSSDTEETYHQTGKGKSDRKFTSVFLFWQT